MNLTISAKRVTIVLVLMVMFITVVNLVGQFYKYLPSDGLLFRLLPNLDPGGDGTIVLFNVDDEGTIPTWYSSSTLLLCSIPLAVIAAATKRSGGSHVLHWWALALIFVFLSMDEAVRIHERMDDVMDRLFPELSGSLVNGWVVPAAAFVLVFVLAYLRFLVALPARTRWLFLVAGVLYVGGAVGMETLWRYVFSSGITNTELDPILVVLISVEELLEMTGVIVFIYALMSYVSTHFKDLHVLVED